jgi:threonine dehydrogenase-like Zn-dependent dehydrogenase
MPKGLYVDRPQHTIIHEYDDPPLKDDEVRFETEFAAMKHGTFFHLFSGESPFENEYFDLEKRLFMPKPSSDETRGLVRRFIGDTAVGRVTEVGPAVASFEVGDRVYAYAPIQETVTRPAAAVRKLPEGLSEQDAVCVDPALYAYTVIRDSRLTLGDDVVMFGLGAIGLFVAQLLLQAGPMHIFAVDPIENRRNLARRFGIRHVLDPNAVDVALEVRKVLGRGADLAIECSGSYHALAEAMRVVDKGGRIAALGYYKGNAAALAFGREWTHNRLEMISSMPVWGNPMREYPLWDEARLFKTIEAFFAQKKITSDGIVHPVVPLAEAAEAFMSIYHDPGEAIKLAVQF